jgi:hypothetical protein
MKFWEVVGYTYDADVHCVACTRGYIVNTGQTLDPDDIDDYDLAEQFTDSEGNELHPMFAGDEYMETEYCGDCGEVIMEAD